MSSSSTCVFYFVTCVISNRSFISNFVPVVVLDVIINGILFLPVCSLTCNRLLYIDVVFVVELSGFSMFLHCLHSDSFTFPPWIFSRLPNCSAHLQYYVE